MQNYEIRQLSIDTPTCTSTILCGEGAFEKYVPELIGGRQFFVVTDSNVYSTYGSLFSGLFSAGGLYVLPAGEGSKNLSRLSAILKAILSFGLKRGGTVELSAILRGLRPRSICAARALYKFPQPSFRRWTVPWAAKRQ